MIDVDSYTIRIFLHLLGVCVWIGGQLVLAALVPVLRGVDPEAPRAAARRFSQVAWPFYGLLVVTGIWNIFEIEIGNRSTGYQAVFGIKLLLVALSGMSAFVHAATSSVVVRAVTGAGGLLFGLGAFACGVLMVT